MIFGVDAMDNLGINKKHGCTNYSELGVACGSSNIARAMRTDPLWKESIEAKQAVQDQFELIGTASKRLSLEKKKQYPKKTK